MPHGLVGYSVRLLCKLYAFQSEGREFDPLWGSFFCSQRFAASSLGLPPYFCTKMTSRLQFALVSAHRITTASVLCFAFASSGHDGVVPFRWSVDMAHERV